MTGVAGRVRSAPGGVTWDPPGRTSPPGLWLQTPQAAQVKCVPGGGSLMGLWAALRKLPMEPPGPRQLTGLQPAPPPAVSVNFVCPPPAAQAPGLHQGNGSCLESPSRQGPECGVAVKRPPLVLRGEVGAGSAGKKAQAWLPGLPDEVGRCRTPAQLSSSGGDHD